LARTEEKKKLVIIDLCFSVKHLMGKTKRMGDGEMLEKILVELKLHFSIVSYEKAICYVKLLLAIMAMAR
jgi:hypothetical protein